MEFHTWLRSVLFLLLLGLTGTAFAQSSDYSQFTANQLLAEADRLKEAGDFTGEARDAVAQRAVELLLVADYSQTGGQATWDSLVELARPALESLTEEQKTQLAARLSGAGLAAGASAEEFKARVRLEVAAGSSRQAIANVVAAWTAGQDISQMSFGDANFCLANYKQDQDRRKKFHIVWTGRITPPRTGDFTLSVSPVNVNKEVGAESVRHSVKITINGAAVLEATPEEWQWRATPASLQAGTPASLRIELDFDCHHPMHSEIPSMLLFWEGPGIARQIIPAEALSLPDGSGMGLRGDYECLTASGDSERVVQVDATLDHVWATSLSLAPRHPQMLTQLSQRIWQLVTDPEYIQSCIEPPPGRNTPNTHPYVNQYYNAEFLSASQRRQFMRLLVENPGLLERFSEGQMLRIYRKLRYGAEEEGLDMVGTWMQLHADIEPAITDNFFSGNRASYRHWTHYLVWNLDQYEELQDRYLETPDGRCSLPAAYTLAYCHLMKDRIADWIDLLDAKLEEPSLTGDRRVNWLLARAMAEEIREVPTDRHFAGGNDVSSGAGWLDEAALAAESGAAKLRIRKERIARLAGTSQWAAAEEEVSAAPTELGDVATRLTELQEQAHARAEQRRLNARNAQIAELTRRRDAAAQRGDSAAAARLSEMLNSIEQSPLETSDPSSLRQPVPRR